jgi:hypothetical protein
VKLYEVYDNDPATNAKYAMNGWEYARPRGVGQGYLGANEYFRILDFEEYLHTANEPLLLSGAIVLVSTQAARTMPIAAIRNENPDTDWELTLADFPDLSAYYFCVVGYLSDNGRIPANPNYFVESAATSLGDGGPYSVSPNFTPSNFSGKLGTWYVYPCLCSVGSISFYQVSGSLPSAYYIPLPCTQMWQVAVTDNARSATLSADKTSATQTSVSFDLTLINDSSNTHIFNAVEVWLMHAGRTPDDVLENDEWRISMPSQTVLSEQTFTYPTQTITIQPSLWQDLVLFATGGSGFTRVGPIAAIVPAPTT